MLDVTFDSASNTFTVVSARVGSTRISYPYRLRSFHAVSETEFIAISDTGMEERYNEMGFKVS